MNQPSPRGPRAGRRELIPGAMSGTLLARPGCPGDVRRARYAASESEEANGTPPSQRDWLARGRPFPAVWAQFPATIAHPKVAQLGPQTDGAIKERVEFRTGRVPDVVIRPPGHPGHNAVRNCLKVLSHRRAVPKVPGEDPNHVRGLLQSGRGSGGEEPAASHRSPGTSGPFRAIPRSRTNPRPGPDSTAMMSLPRRLRQLVQPHPPRWLGAEPLDGVPAGH
jgi:hypothetical protein